MQSAQQAKRVGVSVSSNSEEMASRCWDNNSRNRKHGARCTRPIARSRIPTNDTNSIDPNNSSDYVASLQARQRQPQQTAGVAVSTPTTLATSQTQLALVNNEVSANQQVIQAAVVHRALYALAARHNQRELPQLNSGGKKANQLVGRTHRHADKKRKACDKEARDNAVERVPTAVELARFAEMCASGTSCSTVMWYRGVRLNAG